MLRRWLIVLIVLLVLVGGLCGCSKTSDNAELIGIAETVSDQPREALERLAAINPDSLPKRDAYYHAFLTLKANDKAYIDHTTDSVITRLLEYYDGSDLYPEVLYYAGRVYSDLGDYPTSLRYFQDALDAVPNDHDNLLLRGAIASQTGRLLNTLRLYDSAIPYLKEAIRVDHLTADTFNIAYDNLLLSNVYKRSGQIDSAEIVINEAYDYSQSLTDAEKADIQLNQAVIQYEKNNLDSALVLVRGLSERVYPLSRNSALVNSSNIYLSKGINDTAYIYATELIHSININNKKSGYYNLLATPLIKLVPRDSLVNYVVNYAKELNSYFNLNNSNQGIIQQSLYNYQLHDRERRKAEDSKETYFWIAMIAIIAALGLLIGVLLYRNCNQKLVIRLNEVLSELYSAQEEIKDRDTIINIDDRYSHSKDVSELKEKIRIILDRLSAEGRKGTIPPEIADSKVYAELSKMAQAGGVIPAQTNIWARLETEVYKSSPDFKKRLTLLAGRPLSDKEYHLCLLIKCGFNQTKCATLLGRYKGAISYQRNNLHEKVFHKEIPLSELDNIIRCL